MAGVTADQRSVEEELWHGGGVAIHQGKSLQAIEFFQKTVVFLRYTSLLQYKTKLNCLPF